MSGKDALKPPKSSVQLAVPLLSASATQHQEPSSGPSGFRPVPPRCVLCGANSPLRTPILWLCRVQVVVFSVFLCVTILYVNAHSQPKYLLHERTYAIWRSLDQCAQMVLVLVAMLGGGKSYPPVHTVSILRKYFGLTCFTTVLFLICLSLYGDMDNVKQHPTWHSWWQSLSVILLYLLNAGLALPLVDRLPRIDVVIILVAQLTKLWELNLVTFVTFCSHCSEKGSLVVLLFNITFLLRIKLYGFMIFVFGAKTLGTGEDIWVPVADNSNTDSNNNSSADLDGTYLGRVGMQLLIE